MQSGKDFRDLICPDSISFKRNHFEFGNRFGRVLFLRTYASFVTDDLISDLTEYARDLILSIDMIPVPTDEAVKEVGEHHPGGWIQTLPAGSSGRTAGTTLPPRSPDHGTEAGELPGIYG